MNIPEWFYYLIGAVIVFIVLAWATAAIIGAVSFRKAQKRFDASFERISREMDEDVRDMPFSRRRRK
jgi:flagellar biosynthesis/type III secretory pathway M-ring protein FliF/YscJ